MDARSHSFIEKLATRRGVLWLGLLSAALIAAAIGGWYWLAGAQPDQPPLETPELSLVSLATEYPELAGILQDPKLDSVYKDFLVAYQQGGEAAALDLANKRGLLNARGDLRLTLELDTTDTAALQAELQANGIQVTAAHDNLMDIAIPIELLGAMMESGDAAEFLESITNLSHIVRIRLPKVGIEDAGSVETESLGMIAADAWQAAGIDGRGVKVGVLDLGFDRYRNLLGSDLPATVTVQSFITGKEIDQSGTPHGTMVAEIIHDIAPQAELYFAAYETDVEERQAAEWLISQGVQIISHSAGSIYGPMDGSTEETRWIDSIVAGGVVWVNSAGNTGYTHYRATFTDRNGNGFHEFDTGDETMEFIPDGRVLLVVNWDDWQTGDQDLDLYILGPDGKEIANSTNIQDGGGDDSAEGVLYNFPDTRTYSMGIYAKKISRPVVIDFFMRDGEIEYYTPEHSVTTPGDAIRAITVGAVNWSDDALENYSSRGPTNDGRLKPEISAPAGISSAAIEDTWIGTSASAPHVSGAAALVLQAFPDYTPDQVREFLLGRAKDLGQSGPDNEFGYGRLFLGQPPDLAALVVATPTPLPSPTPTITPGAATVVPTVTSTPERRDLATPVAGENDDDSSMTAALGVLLCVVVPAILGLGGIGLIGGIFYLTRRRGQPLGGRPLDRQLPGGRYDPMGGAPRQAARPQPYQPVRPHIADANTCPRCGSEHRPDARFCPVCGLALADDLYSDADRPFSSWTPPEAPKPAPPAPEGRIYCNQCGQPLRPESKFCPRCGARRP